jgi:hypothetical protein
MEKLKLGLEILKGIALLIATGSGIVGILREDHKGKEAKKRWKRGFIATIAISGAFRGCGSVVRRLSKT